MRALPGSWRVLVGAALLATIALTGCTAGSTSSPGAAGDGQPTSQPATTPLGTPPTGQSSAPTPSASSTESAGIENLLVSSALRSQLTAVYVAFRQISVSDVSGTRPNSVYYAYDQATNAYWAMADFMPAQTAPQNVQVNFQDGGSTGLFTKIGSGPWRVRQGGIPAVCVESQFFPKSVLAAWAISTNRPAGLNC
jgi:hypothetical protein